MAAAPDTQSVGPSCGGTRPRAISASPGRASRALAERRFRSAICVAFEVQQLSELLHSVEAVCHIARRISVRHQQFPAEQRDGRRQHSISAIQCSAACSRPQAPTRKPSRQRNRRKRRKIRCQRKRCACDDRSLRCRPRSDVAELEYEIAEKSLTAMQTRIDAGTANLHDLDDARAQVSERFIALQDVTFELRRADLGLLRATGDLEKWALGPSNRTCRVVAAQQYATSDLQISAQRFQHQSQCLLVSPVPAPLPAACWPPPIPPSSESPCDARWSAAIGEYALQSRRRTGRVPPEFCSPPFLGEKPPACSARRMRRRVGSEMAWRQRSSDTSSDMRSRDIAKIDGCQSTIRMKPSEQG